MVRDLVISSVEKILVNVGIGIHDKVLERLDRKHNCGLGSCYEHPEYLREVLEELFQNEADTILKIISRDLKKNYEVEEFCKKLKK